MNFPIDCSCSIYNNIPHQVSTASDWARHCRRIQHDAILALQNSHAIQSPSHPNIPREAGSSTDQQSERGDININCLVTSHYNNEWIEISSDNSDYRRQEPTSAIPAHPSSGLRDIGESIQLSNSSNGNKKDEVNSCTSLDMEYAESGSHRNPSDSENRDLTSEECRNVGSASMYQLIPSSSPSVEGIIIGIASHDKYDQILHESGDEYQLPYHEYASECSPSPHSKLGSPTNSSSSGYSSAPRISHPLDLSDDESTGNRQNQRLPSHDTSSAADDELNTSGNDIRLDDEGSKNMGSVAMNGHIRLSSSSSEGVDIRIASSLHDNSDQSILPESEGEYQLPFHEYPPERGSHRLGTRSSSSGNMSSPRISHPLDLSDDESTGNRQNQRLPSHDTSSATDDELNTSGNDIPLGAEGSKNMGSVAMNGHIRLSSSSSEGVDIRIASSLHDNSDQSILEESEGEYQLPFHEYPPERGSPSLATNSSSSGYMCSPKISHPLDLNDNECTENQLNQRLPSHDTSSAGDNSPTWRNHLLDSSDDIADFEICGQMNLGVAKESSGGYSELSISSSEYAIEENLLGDSARNNDVIDGENNETTFDYIRSHVTELTRKEIVSLAHHDNSVTYHVSREACNEWRRLIAAIGPPDEAPYDYRTTVKLIKNRTGIDEVRFDCCRNSCMSYALHKKEVECLYCHHPRINAATKLPYAQHSYIPVIHRLRLYWSDPDRAAEMLRYRQSTEKDRGNKKLSDFWTGKYYNDLRNKGLFGSLTDMGFTLSTDGVKVFKTRSVFNIWPLALVNLNLPPTIRFKKRNMILLGFIPGPNNPKDLDSFLSPLVDEMLTLQTGIMAWNSAKRETFTLRAHIVICTADIPAREKLMSLKGNRSYCYCPYCTCRGIFNRGMYCPLTPPSNPPESSKSSEAVKKNGYPWTNYDPGDLPKRTDRSFREAAAHIATTGDDKAAHKTGIRGESILSSLTSIDFPRSFPPDSMHLYFERVVPSMVKHYRGTFFEYRDNSETEVLEDDKESTASSNPADDSVQIENHKRKRRRGVRDVRGSKPSKIARPNIKRNPQKFRVGEDEWSIPPDEWYSIGRDQESSATDIPGAFGRSPRNFAGHIHELSAEEWKMQATLFLPIYLKNRLPASHYNQFCNLVEIISLTTENTLQVSEVEIIRQRLLTFYRYYEETFYGYKWQRIAACLPVFHQLLHVADFLEDLGPMHVYAQWAMERLCGMITRTAKSRVKANRNMENNMLLMEAKHCLSYVTNSADFRAYESDDENRSGTLMLTRIFERRLQSGMPQNSRIAVGSCLLTQVRDHQKMLGRTERRKLLDYAKGLTGWASYMSDGIPHTVKTWKRLKNISEDGNSNVDFTLISSEYRDSNNTRSSSMARYELSVRPSNEEQHYGYGMVLFLFTVGLPAELEKMIQSEDWTSNTEDVDENDSDEDITLGTRVHRLAYVQEFDVLYDGPLIRLTTHRRHVVIPIESILGLVGLVRNGKEQYICTKYTSLLVDN